MDIIQYYYSKLSSTMTMVYHNQIFKLIIMITAELQMIQQFRKRQLYHGMLPSEFNSPCCSRCTPHFWTATTQLVIPHATGWDHDHPPGT